MDLTAFTVQAEGLKYLLYFSRAFMSFDNKSELNFTDIFAA